jgi:hypothetical protein
MSPEAVPAVVNSRAWTLHRQSADSASFARPYEMRHAYGTDNLISAGYDGTGRSSSSTRSERSHQ